MRRCRLWVGILLVVLIAALHGCSRGDANGVKPINPQPKPAVALWVFVDTSGSVFQAQRNHDDGEPQIQEMTNLFEQVVDDLGGVYDEFAVYQFFHTVDILTRKRPQDATEVFRVSDSLKEAIKKNPRLKTLRGTFIAPVLRKIRDEAEVAQGKSIFVLILTDGGYDDRQEARLTLDDLKQMQNVRSILVGPVLTRDRIRSINEDLFAPLRANDRVIITGRDDIQDNLEKWEAMIHEAKK
jgi:hypothetical protein